MKLLLILLLWSQGAYAANANASATASSSSAAADVKGAAAQEKEGKAIHGTIPMRSAAVSEATGMGPKVSDIVAEYAHGYPEMPPDVMAELIRLKASDEPGEPKIVYQWLDANPRNVSAIRTYNNGKRETSLLIMAIEAYNESRFGVNREAQPQLLRKILFLNPDVRYEAKGKMTSTALEAICDVISRDKDEHMGFVKTIIDLLIQQGDEPAAIESELKALLAHRERQLKAFLMQYKDAGPPGRREEFEYARDIAASALEYLHDLQAASIVEEEMTQHLRIRDLGVMSAEYVEPSYKKHKKHMHHHRKSGDSAK